MRYVASENRCVAASPCSCPGLHPILRIHDDKGKKMEHGFRILVVVMSILVAAPPAAGGAADLTSNHGMQKTTDGLTAVWHNDRICIREVPDL